MKSCLTLLQPHTLWPTKLLCLWDFSGKNTGVGCHFLLQGIFPIQGWNPCVLLWQADSLPLSHQGSPIITFIKIKYCSSSVAKSYLTLWCHGLQHARPPCPSSSPWVHRSSFSLNRWCYPTISSLAALFSFCISQHQGLFKWGSSSHQVAKVLELNERSLKSWLNL